MKILFNKIFLEHNPEAEGEGAYCIKDFCDLPDTPGTSGEKYLELVHTKRYIRKIQNACKFKSTLAEIKLSPKSYEAACAAVSLTIQASEQNAFAVNDDGPR